MSRMFKITLWVLVLLTAPAGIFTVAGSVFISPVSGLLGMVFGAVYLVLIPWLLSRTPLWPDFRSGRRMPDGSRRKGDGATWTWMLACLMWGGSASFAVVMVTALPIMGITDKLGWVFVSASLGGAYPEEIVKSLGILLILYSFRQLNRPWHGLVTGAIVGLGFEVNENILYGATGALMDPNSDFAGLISMWQLRTFVGPLLHTVFSAIAGYGIALALFRAGKSAGWRWAVGCGWVFIAFTLHFAWNLLWENTVIAYVNIVVVCLVMYPLIGYLIWTCWRQARVDASYAWAPGAITSTRELSLIDAHAVENRRT
ncbi:PrsW family intramembrane metalloprotease [Corynebacterium pacaense]|uniref:PrsW family intramembrane metalloprotease n=1 Tax=Corynebacterium pacaense TaxID=1816684 RepID=UPI0009BC5FC3|nr:PrsW family intramembrane metalloprotease [Corynebacterium pacaense]